MNERTTNADGGAAAETRLGRFDERASERANGQAIERQIGHKLCKMGAQHGIKYGKWAIGRMS